MRRAQPISEQECQQLKDKRGFPDWNYMPTDEIESPLEHKASDWGRLPDGRLVALDYSSARNSSGSLATLTAMRRALSQVQPRCP
jgi:hypothetical protein